MVNRFLLLCIVTAMFGIGLCAFGAGLVAIGHGIENAQLRPLEFQYRIFLQQRAEAEKLLQREIEKDALRAEIPNVRPRQA